MTLGLFIIMLLAGIGAIYFGMSFVAHAPRQSVASDDSERVMTSTLLVVTMLLALAARPVEFGVDTLTYFRLFDQFCFSQGIDLDLSYKASFSLLNLVQVGACNSWYLATAWIAVIALCFAGLPDPVRVRVKLAGLALFSLIGIELATNALRQGVSAAVMMLAFAWFRRHRAIGVALAVYAVVLHVSTALVLLAVAVSFLRLRYFLVAFALLAALVLSYSYLGLDIEALNRLTGEIDKYSAHDADDLYVRILAAAQLFVPLAVAFVTRWWTGREPAETRADFAMALRISLTALPFLSLPYFGYRYIYGLYPVVLYLNRASLLDNRRPAFEMVLLANALIALVWALGSSYIGQIAFVTL